MTLVSLSLSHGRFRAGNRDPNAWGASQPLCTAIWGTGPSLVGAQSHGRTQSCPWWGAQAPCAATQENPRHRAVTKVPRLSQGLSLGPAKQKSGVKRREEAAGAAVRSLSPPAVAQGAHCCHHTSSFPACTMSRGTLTRDGHTPASAPALPILEGRDKMWEKLFNVVTSELCQVAQGQGVTHRPPGKSLLGGDAAGQGSKSRSSCEGGAG